MNTTSIEWVRNPDGTAGYTFNPITGCLNHDKGICKGGGFPCYAYRLATTRLQQRYLSPGAVLAPSFCGDGHNPSNEPFYPRFWPERLKENLGRSPRGIFVSDMSDLFGMGVPEGWMQQVLQRISRNPRHRFYLLTKQPQNLPQWSPFRSGVWVGVTVTRRAFLTPALEALAKVKATVKYLSCEPLLEDLGMTPGMLREAGVNWVIAGGQTHPTVYTQEEHRVRLSRACWDAKIPMFFKSNSGILPHDRRSWVQEFPEVKA